MCQAKLLLSLVTTSQRSFQIAQTSSAKFAAVVAVDVAGDTLSTGAEAVVVSEARDEAGEEDIEGIAVE